MTAVPGRADDGVIVNSQLEVPGQYIVELASGTDEAGTQAQQLIAEYGGRLLDVYDHVLGGFSVSMSREDALALSADTEVVSVTEDSYVTLETTTQTAQVPTGLDRIDQRDLPRDTTYTYAGDGTGVTVYIIDSGISYSNDEFGGRAVFGTDEVSPQAIPPGSDCNGHGTHVAGTVGGSTYGVAKGVTLVSVRVVGCGNSGQNSDILDGIDWVTGHHQAGVPAVANMSIGGTLDPLENSAVEASIADGITYTIAAGNESTDACSRSPASAAAAITVGSVSAVDARAASSNYGPCVDVFAPGTGILSAWIPPAGSTATNTTATKSGTSMAAPHVAGVAALYLETHRGAMPATVAGKITSNATVDHVTDPVGGPNLLLYSRFLPDVGSIYEVTRTDDRNASCAIGDCSLREAIAAANGHAGPDRIFFDITGSPPFTITTGSTLPSLSDPVILDATSQTGYAGSPLVELAPGGSVRIGLTVTNGGSGSTIRGFVINRFTEADILIPAGTTGVTVEANYIGTDLTGTSRSGTTQDGIDLFGSSNRIGDPAPYSGNTISGPGIGIRLDGGSSNVVAGNLIGTNAAGTISIGTTFIAIRLAGSGNTIGGTASGMGNVISGTTGEGILVTSASDNLIQGNRIGTDVTGSQAVPNHTGIRFTSGSGNVVGGTARGAANLIAYNFDRGIAITGTARSERISGNSIHDNGTVTPSLGVDLADDGLTPNDEAALDADSGPNDLQNFPTLDAATISGAAILMDGSLTSTPNTTFTLEFFSNATCGPSGYGEGEAFEGETPVSTDANGIASFSDVVLRQVVPTGQYVTATATDAQGNTSEFSACRQVGTGPPVDLVVNTTDDTDDGVCTATHCSFREALLAADAQPGADLIAFDIPGTPPFTIAPTTVLPDITSQVTIDGTTQPGFAGVPIVEVSGANVTRTSGLTLKDGASDSTIRGLVVNRFAYSGIQVLGPASGVTIQGNYIGVDTSGTGAAGNRERGILLWRSSDNIVGGPMPADRNVVAGNRFIEVDINGGDNNVVQGNFLGTNATASAAVPGTGVSAALSISGSNNVIGGTGSGAGNVLVSRGGYGIQMSVDTTATAGNLIQGNRIGIDPSGTTPIGSGLIGVQLDGQDNVLGGVAPGAPNIITNNSREGVRVEQTSSGNTISGNSIFGNAINTTAPGIELGNDRVTPNDVNDIDTGANGLQNFPVLSGAVAAAGTTEISGTLNSTPSSTFHIELFSNPACSPTGNGEGKTYLGSFDVSTDGSGNATLSHTVAQELTIGSVVTATATDPGGNTSEFSKCRAVTAPTRVPDAPTNVSATPGNARATVTWTPPTFNGGSAITGYVVTVSPGGATKSVGVTTSTTITGLQNGTPYTFTVAARNAAGTGPPSEPSNEVTPSGVPGAPTGVAAIAGNASATVSWTAPTSNGGSPIISYEVVSSPATTTVTVDASTTSAVMTGLSNGTSYRFRVRAVNASGPGAYSAYSTAVVPHGTPGAPTAVVGVSGNGAVTVSWTAPASNGGSPITSYTVVAQPGGATVTVSGSSRSAVVAGLQNGTPYTFTVVAINVSGSGPASQASAPVTPSATIHPIVFASNRAGSSNYDIWMVNPDGTGLVKIVGRPGSDLDPALSPDGDSVVFVSSTSSTSKLWILDLTDGSLRQLTTHGFLDRDPNWSPDGSKIVFASTQDGGTDFEIYTMSADGSGTPQRLTSTANNVQDLAPAWSPDGTIAFASNRLSNREIWTIDAVTGANPTRLTTRAGSDDVPSWSPSGDRITFTVSDPNGAHVWVMGSHGENPTDLSVLSSPVGAIKDLAPAWSPDGAQLVFASTRAQSPNTDLYIMDVQTGGVVRLTNAPNNDSAPDW